MTEHLRVGLRIDLVEILPAGITWYTPVGSQRLVYPSNTPLVEYTGERIFNDDNHYVYGYNMDKSGGPVFYDVFLHKSEVKRIGCFVIKELKCQEKK